VTRKSFRKSRKPAPTTVALHTLAPGSKFRTPDWPKCPGWPDEIKGWEGRVERHGVGSSVITRDGNRIAISCNTQVWPL
jgi:hypothetical protein